MLGLVYSQSKNIPALIILEGDLCWKYTDLRSGLP